MICDFCKHEVVLPESRELLIRAWCPNCGAFSDGKTKMTLPALNPNFFDEMLRHTALVPTPETIIDRLREREKLPEAPPDVFVNVLVQLLREKVEEAHIYRSTLKAAQEAGTKLWNKVVRVKNLLRVAQPYLEQDNARNPDELELAALCNEIEKEIGSLEDNTTEEDGRMVAERLGIDMEKWAEEIRAKIDAADAREKSRE